MQSKLIDVLDLLDYLSYLNVVKDYLVKGEDEIASDFEVEITVKNTITLNLNLNDAYWYLQGIVDAQV